MSDFLTSSATSNSTDYREFHRYYVNSFHYEPVSDKDKIIIEDPPKKEKDHIFDIKDLDL